MDSKSNVKYSPMINEYLKTKEEYSDCILFYRLGDFYEMFFEDAEIVSKELDLVLTAKACGNGEKAPMCGVPFHSAENYILKLVENGHKVAIAEQSENSNNSKGLMSRNVVKVVTPGTMIDSNISSFKENNYLMSVFYDGNIGASWCDLSTGDFCATLFCDSLKEEKLLETILRINPSEIVVNFKEDTLKEFWNYSQLNKNFLVTNIKPHLHYTDASSMLLVYLEDTQKQKITHLEPLRIINDVQNMRLDRSSLRNLEITETIFNKTTHGSLLGVLDKCKTAMGSRRLRQWISEPLIECDKIKERLDAVECLKDNEIQRNNIRSFLKNIYDIERLVARISLGTANPRDLLALKQSISVLADIKNELSDLDNTFLVGLNNQINDLDDIYSIIDSSILEDAQISLREGGIIKRGYCQELDDINDSITDSKKWISELENNERNRTGIKNLKVRYNKVFGYYIEVTNSQLNLVPQDYIRKQTLVGSERFFTNELKDAENILLNAQTKINELEYKIFCEIRQFIKDRTDIIQKTAMALSILDVVTNFAQVAIENGYNKPEINNGDVIRIKNGRHPVIEKTMNHKFVPNDTVIDRSEASLTLITGPNMAGKSTYMRQLALIVLMAQTGSFVPVDEAEIGICDRIYTRIGAGDNISMGQSTFFVEMSELAYILNTATDKSLIILDEIGRGTSTLDGLAIAWAVVEKLSSKKIRTLFATHYHELTNLEGKLDGLKNLKTSIKEENNSIIFEYKVMEGAADKSYGVQVAKLAGVPEEVIKNAKEKLSFLENLESKESGSDNNLTDKILEKISSVNTMNISAAEAIKIIEDLKKEID